MKQLKELKRQKRNQHNCNKRDRWDPNYWPIKCKIIIPNNRNINININNNTNSRKRDNPIIEWSKRRKPKPPHLEHYKSDIIIYVLIKLLIYSHIYVIRLWMRTQLC